MNMSTGIFFSCKKGVLQVHSMSAVLRIHDILVRLRMRIRKALNQLNPTDPDPDMDPEHWYN
jgi:hypothetical protein